MRPNEIRIPGGLDPEIQEVILQLNSVNELVNRITESSDLDTTFSSLVQGIQKELEYDRVGILTPDDGREGLRLNYALGLPRAKAEAVRLPLDAVAETALELLEHRRVNVLRSLTDKGFTKAFYECLGEEPSPCAVIPFSSWHQKRCWQIDHCFLGHSALASVPDSHGKVRVSSGELCQVCSLCEFFPMRGILWVDNAPSGRAVRERLFPLWVLAKQAALTIENAVLYDRSRRLTIRDGLTGLYNRRHVLEVVDYEVDRSRRFKHAFSVLTLDVDGFSGLNEKHSYKGGDELVRYLAVLLRRSVRDIDVLARCGTDQFAVLFPKTEREDSVRAGERIRAKVEGFPFYLGGEEVHVTVSGGVATFPEDGACGRDLLFMAEKALDQARHKGGNRVLDARPWRP
jgi:diguanylate cyclase (GGDEF)-like protein